MGRKRPSRRDREEIKKMNVTKTPRGAAGWIPADADDSLALDAMLVHAHTGAFLPEYFKDLTRRRRQNAGVKGAKAGAIELPEDLVIPVAVVIGEPPENRRDIMRAIRNGLDEAVIHASGPGVPIFRRWYDGSNRDDNGKLSAMLERSIPGFRSWLESFPPE
jgi:hypothetical protein